MAILILLFPMFGLAADAAKPKDNPKTKLVLAGDQPAGAETVDALVSNSWAQRGTKNILGQGVDEILTFKKTDKGELSVEQTTRKFRSVNERAPAGAPPVAPYTETKTTLPAEVDRSVLRYGDRRQSFVLVPKERLILNALVPLGEGKWYYASQREEMLFTFAADPVQKEHGDGTLQVCSDGGKVHTIKITFDLASSSGRIIRVVADTEQKAVWAEIQFDAAGKYGLMIGRVDQKSQVLTPVAR
jgi:hypothetical protein